jgi:beta-glucosidase
VAELGDLCRLWCTINERIVYATYSYLLGEWPPGMSDITATFRVAAALLHGHAAAARAIRQENPALRVGLGHHMRLFDPATRSPLDAAAAAAQDYLFNEAVLAALRTGRLPPPLGLGIVPGLRDSCDFIGLNYSTRDFVAFDPRLPQEMFGRRFTAPGAPRSDPGRDGKPYGEIYPQGLYRALLRVARLGLPIYITETGLPDADDSRRPQFILEHLAAVHRAIEAGADVRGVFLWSLVDNFEWAEGWGLRFGLYALDERTGERRLRPSGALYAAIARANALPSPTDSQV